MALRKGAGMGTARLALAPQPSNACRICVHAAASSAVGARISYTRSASSNQNSLSKGKTEAENEKEAVRGEMCA